VKLLYKVNFVYRIKLQASTVPHMRG